MSEGLRERFLSEVLRPCTEWRAGYKGHDWMDVLNTQFEFVHLDGRVLYVVCRKCGGDYLDGRLMGYCGTDKRSIREGHALGYVGPTGKYLVEYPGGALSDAETLAVVAMFRGLEAIHGKAGEGEKRAARELHDVCDRVCAELPDDMAVVVQLARGCGEVMLEYGVEVVEEGKPCTEGHTLHLDDGNGELISELVGRALEVAKDKEAVAALGVHLTVEKANEPGAGLYDACSRCGDGLPTCRKMHGGYAVECVCGVCGPVGESPAEAVCGWNRFHREVQGRRQCEQGSTAEGAEERGGER